MGEREGGEAERARKKEGREREEAPMARIDVFLAQKI